MRNILLSFVLILAVILAGCSGAARPAQEAMPDKAAGPAEAVMEKTETPVMKAEDQASMTEKPGEMMEEQPQEMVDGDKMMEGEGPDTAMAAEDPLENADEMLPPAFFQVALTDAASGQTFRMADFKGKVVLVETLAMWCSNCLRQQKQVQALHERLGERDDFVSLGLDIDTNENLGDLKAYVTSQGFDWLYAVAPVEVAREIAQLYGDQFLNPPSTPMFIIDRHGAVHPLPFGVKSAEDLQKALEPFLNDGM